MQVGLTSHPSSRGICAVTVSEFLMDICVIEIYPAPLLIQAENKNEIDQDPAPALIQAENKVDPLIPIQGFIDEKEIPEATEKNSEKKDISSGDIWDDFRQSSSEEKTIFKESTIYFEFENPDKKEYKRVQKLGQGAFGTCVRMIHVESNEQFAAKCFKKQLYDSQPRLFELVSDYNF